MNSKYCKYPRTPHLPWSRGGTNDDVNLAHSRYFEGREVVVTEKMDGENTSFYREGMHARSLDSGHHHSRDWVKALRAQIAHSIPEGWRLCGENVYAQHSVKYTELESYFYLFSVWDEKNLCLSWDETTEWAELFGLSLVNVLYRGPWNEEEIRSLNVDIKKSEGYVVRLVERFSYEDFKISMGKWVRPHHVQTDQHWMHSEIIPNQLVQKK